MHFYEKEYVITDNREFSWSANPKKSFLIAKMQGTLPRQQLYNSLIASYSTYCRTVFGVMLIGYYYADINYKNKRLRHIAKVSYRSILLHHYLNKWSAVAEMGNRLATIDIGRKWEGLSPLFGGKLVLM